MHRSWIHWVGIGLILGTGLELSRAAPPANEFAEDELLLKTQGLASDGPALLDFFRKRSPSAADQKRLGGLIQQLGDRDFQTRETASTQLIALGPLALPELKRTLQDPDPEIRRRAEQCLEDIEQASVAPLASAVARLLRLRQPAGTTPVLLGYLPFANDEGVEQEIQATLVALAGKEGKVDAALVAALHDPLPQRRAAAALVLGRFGSADQRAAVQKLLVDGDARVRLRAAQALLAARDKSALPALVALLGDGPLDLAGQAEDLLLRAAGAGRPRAPLGEDELSRRKCRDAWTAWWKLHENRLDLTRADVDLKPVNVVQQARVIAKQFMTAIFKGDVATLKKTTAVPFLMPGGEFANQKEITDFFKVVGTRRGTRQFRVSVRGVSGLEEYLRIAPDEEKKSLARLRKTEIRAVYVEGGVEGQADGGTILVRISGGRARVIGIGEGKPPGMLGR